MAATMGGDIMAQVWLPKQRYRIGSNAGELIWVCEHSDSAQVCVGLTKCPTMFFKCFPELKEKVDEDGYYETQLYYHKDGI
jgi:hypothetical protein